MGWLKGKGFRLLLALWGVCFALGAEAARTKTTLPQLTPEELAYEFSVPEELREQVDFWIKVYTKYSSDEVIIHDKKYLNIIYTTIDFSELNRQRLSPRTRRRRMAKEIGRKKRYYIGILKKLAHQKRIDPKKLGPEERRVYEMFAGVKEKHKFARAAQKKRLRAQVGQRDRFIKGLEESGLYMREIERIFAKYHLPQELTLLPFVESFFNPQARSSSGAVGIWQFIRSTGRLYGLRINSIVDERRDPFAASDAAARLLLDNFRRLRSWPLAITAYNHGTQGVARAVRKTKSNHLPHIIRNYSSRRFGFASQNFYAEFLAVLEIVPNRDRYFGWVKIKEPMEFDVVTLPDYVTVATLCKYCQLTKEEIARLNPALTRWVLSSRRRIPKGYALRIPEGTKETFLRLYAKIPASRRFAAQVHEGKHRVRWGETLWEIARRYNTTVAALAELNGLRNMHKLRAGQVLLIPEPGKRYKKRRKSTAGRKRRKSLAVAARETKSSGAGEGIAPPPVDSWLARAEADLPEDYVIVRPYETVGHYAEWCRVSASRIRRLNGLSYRQKLHVGQRLRIDLSRVDRESFDQQRRAYHAKLEREFFNQYVVERVTTHTLKPNQNVWYLCRYVYKVPLWLVERYNTGKDLTQMNAGDKLRIPIVRPVNRSS